MHVVAFDGATTVIKFAPAESGETCCFSGKRFASKEAVGRITKRSTLILFPQEFEFESETSVGQEMCVSICVPGVLKDKADLQRGWGVEPRGPDVSATERLRRYYYVYNREKVGRASRSLCFGIGYIVSFFFFSPRSYRYSAPACFVLVSGSDSRRSPRRKILDGGQCSCDGHGLRVFVDRILPHELMVPLCTVTLIFRKFLLFARHCLSLFLLSCDRSAQVGNVEEILKMYKGKEASLCGRLATRYSTSNLSPQVVEEQCTSNQLRKDNPPTDSKPRVVASHPPFKKGVECASFCVQGDGS